MRTISAQVQAILAARRVTSFALCWQVTMTNGVVVRGTEHDQDVEVTTGQFAGTFRSAFNVSGSDIKSSSDLSVDNMEIEGAVDQLFALSIRVEDIESGVLEGASVVVMLIDWTAPDAGQVVVRSGYLGGITRDSNDRYRAEVRGLAQKLQQQIGQNYSEQCNVVRFGDSRCGFNVASITLGCVVASVTDRRHFTCEVVDPSNSTLPSVLPRGGEVTWTSGDNSGFTREAKAMSLSGSTFTIELYEETAADLEIGDLLDVVPGCDRLASTCRFVYDNLVNFRGHGMFIPGVLAMMRGNVAPGECVVPELVLPEVPPAPDTDEEQPAPPSVIPEEPSTPPPVLPGAGDDGPLDGISGSAHFVIPASMTLFDGNDAAPVGGGARRRVSPGEIIEIAARNGPALTIRNVNGSADNYVFIRGPSSGQAIIRRTAPRSGGQALQFEACRYLAMDGHSSTATPSADGRRYGIVVTYSLGSSDSNRDGISHFIKTRGRSTESFTNCRDFIMRNFEVDGGWNLTGSKFADNGIGVSTNDRTFKALNYPGVYQANMIFERFYVHHCQGEGFYIGANPYLSYRHEGGHEDESLGAEVPLRAVKVRYGTAHHIGGNAYSGKSWFGGEPGGDGDDENSMHDLVGSECGIDPGAHGTPMVSSNSSKMNIYNIIGIDNGGPTVGCFTSNGTAASLDFDWQVWNIVSIRCTGHGIHIRQGTQEQAPNAPPIPRARVWNATVVGTAGGGITLARVTPNSWVRNCIALDNDDAQINPGPGTKANNLESGNPASVFVSYGSDDLHLDAQQLAVGTRGVEISFDDIEGVERPAGSASKGAYQFV